MTDTTDPTFPLALAILMLFGLAISSLSHPRTAQAGAVSDGLSTALRSNP